VRLCESVRFILTNLIVYRVNWLRAKARYARWEEEYNLVRHEMVWTVKYFQHRKRQWEERRIAVSDDGEVATGLQCYAAKQVGLWWRFAEEATAKFKSEIHDLHIADGEDNH
jgi:hypothetical protein